MASRWAATAGDTAAAEQRKRDKLEKKRQKEEQARQTAAKAAAAAAMREEQAVEEHSRPSKRRRLSNSPPPPPPAAPEPEAHLLNFPNPGFSPSSSVDDFELLNAIEEGSYGKVSRARTKRTGEIVALKKLKVNHSTDEGFPITGLREIQTLTACSHLHIIQLREVVTGLSLSDVYLVMPFVEHDLKTILTNLSEPFLPSESKLLLQQLTSALVYLHSQHILHRDIKTSNLLLNNRGELKLADFGMARSPELLLGTRTYDAAVDIWSLGCIFAELLTREPLFQGKNEVDQLARIFALLGTPTSESWPGFRSLPNAKALHPVLAKAPELSSRLTANKFPYLSSAGLGILAGCLSMNPLDRPSAADVLNDKYFAEEPRPKAKEMFPTFPSKAALEKTRMVRTPPAPSRGDAPNFDERDVVGMFSEV